MLGEFNFSIFQCTVIHALGVDQFEQGRGLVLSSQASASDTIPQLLTSLDALLLFN